MYYYGNKKLKVKDCTVKVPDRFKDYFNKKLIIAIDKNKYILFLKEEDTLQLAKDLNLKIYKSILMNSKGELKLDKNLIDIVGIKDYSYMYGCSDRIELTSEKSFENMETPTIEEINEFWK